MGDSKKEVLNVKDSNISKLNVSRGEELTELYAQNNMLTELDLTGNKNLEILECDGNPLKYISAIAPGGGNFPLEMEAGAGGYVSLKLAPGVQQYKAEAEEGYEFDGWYDELGDRLSKEPVWNDAYGASRRIVAWFKKK